MLSTSSRLLRLMALLQTRRFWPGPELAERLEVTPRTLRRDMDRLRSLGFPVSGSAGVAGGYQLDAGAVLPPVSREEDEALAISIALGTIASGSVSGVEEAAVRALVKLERVLPVRLRRRAATLRASIVPIERSGPRVDSEILSTLATACSDHQRVTFRYSGRGGEKSERTVEPAGVVHTGLRWYLVAWDTLRGDWRTFRLDRLSGKVTLGVAFVPKPLPDGGDLRKYVSRNVSTITYQHRASVVLMAPLKQLRERVSPVTGMLEPIDDQRTRLVTGAQSLDSLALWIALIGVDFQIEEPSELRDHVRTIGKRLLSAGKAAP